MSSADRSPFPRGCFPTMITPMNGDKSINYPAVKALTEWYIEAGCTGLFANCLSSEMFHLTSEERVELTRFVTETAKGRCVVVSSGGLNCASIEDQAAFVKTISKHCDAVVIVVNQMAAEDEDDATWKENVQKLLDLTGNIPLGLYECPSPYHRLLSAELLGWAAATGRFYFHKDTCCKLQPIVDKLGAITEATKEMDTPFRFYNANVATLQKSIQAGAAGFSGISANFYPQLLVWLAANPDHERASHVQATLSVFENVVASKYPTAAKYFQSLFETYQGTAVVCRCQDLALNEEERLKLEALFKLSSELICELGMKPLVPSLSH
eukprot:m.57041 g.57041  ORF g.57041 m.57041 type:complete len:325 (+) comp11584_c1_seq4:39-1013(+)